MKEKHVIKHWQQPWWLTVLGFLLCTALITASAMMIQPGSIEIMLQSIRQTPVLLVLNGLPVALLLLLFYGAVGNVFTAAGMVSLVVNTLNYINLLKIDGRNDPFVPADVGLIREGLSAAGEYQLDLHPAVIACIVLMAAFFLTVGFFARGRKRMWVFRIAVCIVAILGSVVSLKTLFWDKDLYAELAGPRYSNVPLVFQTLGFNYCFVYNLDMYRVEVPEGYSESAVRQWEAEGETAEAVVPDNAPNIIYIMGEAFSDLSQEDVFDYTEETNPIAGFAALTQSEYTFSGHLVVSNIYAGTANTEFNVLTGMQTNAIGAGTTSAFRTIRKNVASMPRVLSSYGYESFFVHPGYSWFYNRSSVYSYLGIDDQTFNDAFTDADYNGQFISDESFLRVFSEKFCKEVEASDTPVFACGVTIENHQAYTASKYDAACQPARITCAVSDAAQEALSVYFTGVAHTSDMLLELTQMLDTLEEPVLLVFYGDHRPNLGDAYAELGRSYGQDDTLEQQLYAYEVPYIVWANQAYGQSMSWSESVAALDLPENGLLCDSYLSSVILELTGMTGQDAYFDYLSQVRREVPAFGQGIYCMADGVWTEELPEETQALLQKMRQWQYYRLKAERLK